MDFFALPLSSFSPVSYSSRMNPFMRPTTDEPVLASRTRLRFQTTSSAVNARPLCHLTLRRRRSVHVLRSGLASHFSTRARARDVVHPRDRQVVAHLPRRVRRLDPAVGVRALEVLAPHAEPEGPALRQRLGLGGRQEPLARDLARERVGRPRGHAEEGRGPQELAAVERALRELPLERGDVRMLSAVCHRRILPGAAISGRSGHGDRVAPGPGDLGAPHTQGVRSTLSRQSAPSTPRGSWWP